MTDEELFEAITTDSKIIYYHDRLAMIDWRVTVCVAERRIIVIKGKIGMRRDPKNVTALKKYLREQYGISSK